MIVYGDPSCSASMAELMAPIQARLATPVNAWSLDDARTLLVRVGQIEQAIEDGARDEGCLDRIREATDHASEAFLKLWLGEGVPREEVLALRRIVDEAPWPTGAFRVKEPEGFAFYGLYPEAYAVAARRWSELHAGARGSVLVVGIRSIGTTLSAVVGAMLRRQGWNAHRVTVRPNGHPFHRTTSLDDHDFVFGEWNLVVDEGPGLSGSSMASVAQALSEAGVPRARIAFFPGHCADPGAEARDDVKQWWATTPRFVCPSEQLRWQGQELPFALGAEEGGDWEDLSAGRWRRHAYADPSAWPGVSFAFERPKYRIRDQLWTFRGLSAPGNRFGFVPTRWIEGTAPTAEDGDAEVAAELARYIVNAASEPLIASELQESIQRISNMLYWNAREALGEPAAEGLRPLTPEPDELLNVRSAGDGRLAPWEWRRTPQGRLMKTNAFRHLLDHTAVGAQPLLWDIAGAIVEWDVTPQDVLHALDVRISERTLRFYVAAYSAFRLGICEFGRGGAAGEEAERLGSMASRYRRRLESQVFGANPVS